jgi:hypothetical protein
MYNVPTSNLKTLEMNQMMGSTHSDPEVDIGAAFGTMFVKHPDSDSPWKKR